MNKILLQLNLPVSVLKEGKKYIAYTPALDLSTSGKTFSEAKKNFNEITKIFFEEIIKKGTLDEVLKDLGWQKKQAKWQPPVVISQELQSIKVSV